MFGRAFIIHTTEGGDKRKNSDPICEHVCCVHVCECVNLCMHITTEFSWWQEDGQDLGHTYGSYKMRKIKPLLYVDVFSGY